MAPYEWHVHKVESGALIGRTAEESRGRLYEHNHEDAITQERSDEPHEHNAHGRDSYVRKGRI